MNDKSCQSMADSLVQYADGELSTSDAKRVAAHVAECPQCRTELGLLQRSLELARAVWQEAARDAPTLPAESIAHSKRRIPAVVGLATCAAAVLAVVVWFSLRDDLQPELKQAAQNGHSVKNPPAENVDIEAVIAREERSARLAASARLLATQPGLEPYRQRAERYLLEAYAGTTAAHSLVRNNIPIPVKEPES